MIDEDLRQIEGLLLRFAAEIRGELREEIRDEIRGQTQRFDAKLEQGLEEQSKNFERWFGVQREAFQHDLAVVTEGHQMLAEKVDRLADEMRARTAAIERDLLNHKGDPHAQGWRVSEDEGCEAFGPSPPQC